MDGAGRRVVGWTAVLVAVATTAALARIADVGAEPPAAATATTLAVAASPATPAPAVPAPNEPTPTAPIATAATTATTAPAAPTATTAPLAQPGPLDRRGDLDGAPYRIVVPVRWNGTLLVFAHRYVGPGGGPDATEILAPQPEDADALVAQGYAVAGTAYRHDGWALDVAADDLAALARYFRDTVAVPRRTLAWGQSMGGLVVATAIEAHPGTFDGALSLCGVVGGATAWWDRSLTFARAYDAAFGWPAAWGTVDEPRPGLDLLRDVSPIVRAQIEDPRNRSRWEFVRRVVGAPEADFYEGGAWLTMGLVTTGRADLIARAGGQPLAAPTGGYTVAADDLAALAADGLDARPLLARMDAAASAAPAPVRDARAWLAEHGEPRGTIDVPLLAVHTEADTLVPAANLAAYADRVTAHGAAPLVAATVPGIGHCQFGTGAPAAAVGLLDRWVGSGERPDATALAALAGSAA